MLITEKNNNQNSFTPHAHTRLLHMHIENTQAGLAYAIPVTTHKCLGLTLLLSLRLWLVSTNANSGAIRYFHPRFIFLQLLGSVPHSLAFSLAHFLPHLRTLSNSPSITRKILFIITKNYINYQNIVFLSISQTPTVKL